MLYHFNILYLYFLQTTKTPEGVCSEPPVRNSPRIAVFLGEAIFCSGGTQSRVRFLLFRQHYLFRLVHTTFSIWSTQRLSRMPSYSPRTMSLPILTLCTDQQITLLQLPLSKSTLLNNVLVLYVTYVGQLDIDTNRQILLYVCSAYCFMFVCCLRTHILCCHFHLISILRLR